jgi:membrane protein YqaA with SNARE-associated domain
VRHWFGILLRLGLMGPFVLGIADSSFLFLPFGNDLLLGILLARDHHRFPLYTISAALGSMVGIFLLDAVCRKGGEEGLKRMLKPKRFEYVKKKIKENAGVAIAIACIAPPPFPFTAVIAAASAFQYPRVKLLTIAFVMRLVRFSLVSWAAIRFGREILTFARSPAFRWSMVAFITICAVGSVISVTQWIRRSRPRALNGY